MNRLSRILGGWILAMVCACAPVSAPALAGMKTAPAPPALKVGDAAPDFKLQYFDGHGLKDVSLQDYRGKKNVVLAFYIFAFTGG
jgi:hypothetical protein